MIDADGFDFIFRLLGRAVLWVLEVIFHVVFEWFFRRLISAFQWCRRLVGLDQVSGWWTAVTLLVLAVTLLMAFL